MNNNNIDDILPSPDELNLPSMPLLSESEREALKEYFESVPNVDMLPTPTPPLEGDKFIVSTTSFDGKNVKSIHLPRFIFSPINRNKEVLVEERGSLSVILDASSISCGNIYKDIILAIKNGLQDIKVEVLSKDEEIVCTWVFPNPLIMAVDFGDLVKTRKQKEKEITIELGYKNFLIDNIEFIIKKV